MHVDDEQGRAVNDPEFNCPHCQTTMTVPPALAGKPAHCPKCQRGITIPSCEPTTLPSSAVPDGPKPSSGLIRAGWICFGLGVCFAVMLFLVPIWEPLFIAAIILGIIATSQKEKGGLALMLCSLFVPPVLAVFLGLVFIVGGLGLAEPVL
jgi:hypothetical protein